LKKIKLKLAKLAKSPKEALYIFSHSGTFD